ncbi:RNA polymerase-binding protein DksA [Pelagibacteraceae bacterium]|jgi:DnaK suppressor protein|nr:RNA polymerase-binding protein DksA [Pelagibacteraceae bacterium]MDB3873200.1 RNA polymerase-binding protein DksA [Pelagibacteraceae bacterium]MDC1148044.1 RNA polymerase-binding protein DksA [Pelagibacteraceae bacterium]|tara:strand:- start:290 stop:706 length:417 start_codon:yes stop_codon:yes gene_type:complete
MPTKISKTYKPSSKEKYMCAKHKTFFRKMLADWKNDLIDQNNRIIFGNDDDNAASADIVDQATSYSSKTVEMRTVNRNKKLIKKIDSAVQKIEEGVYGYCEVTGEEIGLKRLMARPIATMTVEAQEQHEKQEKVFAED